MIWSRIVFNYSVMDTIRTSCRIRFNRLTAKNCHVHRDTRMISEIPDSIILPFCSSNFAFVTGRANKSNCLYPFRDRILSERRPDQEFLFASCVISHHKTRDPKDDNKQARNKT